MRYTKGTVIFASSCNNEEAREAARAHVEKEGLDKADLKMFASEGMLVVKVKRLVTWQQKKLILQTE